MRPIYGATSRAAVLDRRAVRQIFTRALDARNCTIELVSPRAPIYPRQGTRYGLELLQRCDNLRNRSLLGSYAARAHTASGKQIKLSLIHI